MVNYNVGGLSNKSGCGLLWKGFYCMHMYKLQPDPQFQYFLPKIDDQPGMIVIM